MGRTNEEMVLKRVRMSGQERINPAGREISTGNAGIGTDSGTDQKKSRLGRVVGVGADDRENENPDEPYFYRIS